MGSLPASRAWLWALGGLAWSLVAWGAEPAGCEVILDPGAPGAWKKAVRGVLRGLATAQDCREIKVEVHPDGSALLRFFTRDGRTTERRLAAPEELGPQVEALVVTMGLPSASAPASAVSSATPPALAPGGVSSPAGAAPGAEVVGGVGVGGRLSARYAAPFLDLALRGHQRGWEVGLEGGWAPWVASRKAKPAGFAMSMLQLGVRVGRRESAGRAALRYGGSLTIAQVHAEADSTAAGGGLSEDRAQSRVGFHAGAVFPRESSLRWLFEVRGDAVLSRANKISSQEPALPLPGLSGMMLLGIEGRLL